MDSIYIVYCIDAWMFVLQSRRNGRTETSETNYRNIILYPGIAYNVIAYKEIKY